MAPQKDAFTFTGDRLGQRVQREPGGAGVPGRDSEVLAAARKRAFGLSSSFFPIYTFVPSLSWQMFGVQHELAR